MTTSGKRKISVTIDAQLLDELEQAGVNVSAQINEALRRELEARRRRAALGDLLRRLTEEDGPLDTAEDEAEMRRYARLLGGSVDTDAVIAS